jgi:hypothetical protein
MATRDEIDMKLRAFVKSHCAPIWWEQGRQVVVNSGSMCVIKTPEKGLSGISCVRRLTASFFFLSLS